MDATLRASRRAQVRELVGYVLAILFFLALAIWGTL